MSSTINAASAGLPEQVPSIAPEFDGQAGAAHFRYSAERFRNNLIIAAGLTAMVCGLTWLLLGIYGVANMNWWTAVAGVIFFAFISARTLAQYLRNDVVLAVQPTGLYDARIMADAIPWDDIKELVLSRREREFGLRVVLWPRKQNRANLTGGEFNIDFSTLEGGPKNILDAIGAYKQIRVEH